MAKDTDIVMPLYVNDYLADTAHLTPQESGAYLHLLMDSWVRGPLPCDHESLRRITRVHPRAWPKVWNVLRAFFQESEAGGLVNPRLEIERRVQSVCAMTAGAK